MENQWQEHLTQYPDCPLVFHRNGQKIKDFRGAWDRACWKVGLAGNILCHCAKVAELVDAQDSGSCGLNTRGGSIPPFRINQGVPLSRREGTPFVFLYGTR